MAKFNDDERNEKTIPHRTMCMVIVRMIFFHYSHCSHTKKQISHIQPHSVLHTINKNVTGVLMILVIECQDVEDDQDETFVLSIPSHPCQHRHTNTCYEVILSLFREDILYAKK
jgi:hypothetical protein